MWKGDCAACSKYPTPRTLRFVPVAVAEPLSLGAGRPVSSVACQEGGGLDAVWRAMDGIISRVGFVVGGDGWQHQRWRVGRGVTGGVEGVRENMRGRYRRGGQHTTCGCVTGMSSASAADVAAFSAS